MTLRVADKHKNLQKQYHKQGVVEVQRLITVTCSAIALAFGNGLSTSAADPQPGNTRRTFADWCREKASLSPEAKHTVEVLLEKAETTECDAANQKISSLRQLDLSNNQISDIKPLQSLTNLTALLLSENKISDIKPLQSLPKLARSSQSLSVSGNHKFNSKTL